MEKKDIIIISVAAGLSLIFFIVLFFTLRTTESKKEKIIKTCPTNQYLYGGSCNNIKAGIDCMPSWTSELSIPDPLTGNTKCKFVTDQVIGLQECKKICPSFNETCNDDDILYIYPYCQFKKKCGNSSECMISNPDGSCNKHYQQVLRSTDNECINYIDRKDKKEQCEKADLIYLEGTNECISATPVADKFRLAKNLNNKDAVWNTGATLRLEFKSGQEFEIYYGFIYYKVTLKNEITEGNSYEPIVRNILNYENCKYPQTIEFNVIKPAKTKAYVFIFFSKDGKEFTPMNDKKSVILPDVSTPQDSYIEFKAPEAGSVGFSETDLWVETDKYSLFRKQTATGGFDGDDANSMTLIFGFSIKIPKNSIKEGEFELCSEDEENVYCVKATLTKLKTGTLGPSYSTSLMLSSEGEGDNYVLIPFLTSEGAKFFKPEKGPIRVMVTDTVDTRNNPTYTYNLVISDSRYKTYASASLPVPIEIDADTTKVKNIKAYCAKYQYTPDEAERHVTATFTPQEGGTGGGTCTERTESKLDKFCSEKATSDKQKGKWFWDGYNCSELLTPNENASEHFYSQAAGKVCPDTSDKVDGIECGLKTNVCHVLDCYFPYIKHGKESIQIGKDRYNANYPDEPKGWQSYLQKNCQTRLNGNYSEGTASGGKIPVYASTATYGPGVGGDRTAQPRTEADQKKYKFEGQRKSCCNDKGELYFKYDGTNPVVRCECDETKYFGNQCQFDDTGHSSSCSGRGFIKDDKCNCHGIWGGDECNQMTADAFEKTKCYNADNEQGTYKMYLDQDGICGYCSCPDGMKEDGENKDKAYCVKAECSKAEQEKCSEQSRTEKIYYTVSYKHGGTPDVKQ